MTAGFGKGSANLRICVRASGLAFYCFLMILDPPLPGRLGLFPIGIDSISVLLPLLSWSACARKHTQRLVKRERERERERECVCVSLHTSFLSSPRSPPCSSSPGSPWPSAALTASFSSSFSTSSSIESPSIRRHESPPRDSRTEWRDSDIFILSDALELDGACKSKFSAAIATITPGPSFCRE